MEPGWMFLDVRFDWKEILCVIVFVSLLATLH